MWGLQFRNLRRERERYNIQRGTLASVGVSLLRTPDNYCSAGLTEHGMHATGQRGLWIIAILTLLGVISDSALCPPLSVSVDSALPASTDGANPAVPAAPAGLFAESTPVCFDSQPVGDRSMEELNPVSPAVADGRVFVSVFFYAIDLNRGRLV